jgi:hypothetical protein
MGDLLGVLTRERAVGSTANERGSRGGALNSAPKGEVCETPTYFSTYFSTYYETFSRGDNAMHVTMLLEDGEPKFEGEFVGTETVKVA